MYRPLTRRFACAVSIPPFSRTHLRIPGPQCFSKTFSQSRIQSGTLARTKENLREGWKRRWESPIAYSLGVVFVTTTIGLFAYVLYDRVTRVEPALTKYPPEVAGPLRRAVYFTEIAKKPVEALLLFRKALVIADDMDMHPFSDEVLGIRLKAVDVLQANGMTSAAIDMLERLEADCSRWIATTRRRQQLEPKPSAAAQLPSASAADIAGQAQEENKGETSETTDDDLANQPWRKEHIDETKLADKLVKKVVGTHLKLAELYMADHPPNLARAEAALSAAVTDAISEIRHRRAAGLPVTSPSSGPIISPLAQAQRDIDPDAAAAAAKTPPATAGAGADFLTLAEAAASMNDLADLYASRRRHDFAALLYMHALALIKQDELAAATAATTASSASPDTADGGLSRSPSVPSAASALSVAQVVLLNNVASQLAEQAQQTPAATAAGGPGTPVSSLPSVVPAARGQQQQQQQKRQLATASHPQPTRAQTLAVAARWAHAARAAAARADQELSALFPDRLGLGVAPSSPSSSSLIEQQQQQEKEQPKSLDPESSSSCALAALAATYNLGEIAEMQDDRAGAARFYADARQVARTLGGLQGSGLGDEYAEAARQAEEALARVRT